MTAARRTTGIGLAAAGALAGWWAFVAAQDNSPPMPPPFPAPAAGPPQLVGQAGCSAGACHGNPSAPSLTADPGADCWQSSFTHWLAADPHTRAFDVLRSDLGKRIVTAWSQGKKTDATKAAECLACHTNPALAADTVTDTRLVGMRPDGVSCEACHGAAGDWLARHLTWKTPADRTGPHGVEKSGMANLNDIGERAKMCAGCHVGAPADPARGYTVPRDMNHDMIAAGHPRLNFDFAGYQRRLTPHWQEKDRTQTDPKKAVEDRAAPGFEAYQWLVGRSATAEAACEFTVDRAARAQSNPAGTPWPELSESNCFACHHNIVPDGKDILARKEPFWRQTPAFFDGRTPGSSPYQTLWPVTPDADLGGAASAALADLRKEMQKPRPKEAVAAAKAQAAVIAVNALRRDLARKSAAESTTALLAAAEKAAAPDRLGRLNWDESGELYQALVTLELVRLRTGGAKPTDQIPGVLPNFTKLREGLILPAGSDGTRTDSPEKYRPDGVGTAFGALLKELKGQLGPK